MFRCVMFKQEILALALAQECDCPHLREKILQFDSIEHSTETSCGTMTQKLIELEKENGLAEERIRTLNEENKELMKKIESMTCEDVKDNNVRSTKSEDIGFVELERDEAVAKVKELMDANLKLLRTMQRNMLEL
eukprot:m.172942 g.172942  ORF g.172942 m.172942 type:complete len:135 (+) comp31708_c0_seq4:121-525(+)